MQGILDQAVEEERQAAKAFPRQSRRLLTYHLSKSLAVYSA
jgi:hypothetical protein